MRSYYACVLIWVSYEQSRHLVIWNNSSRTCSWSCTVLQVSTYEGKSVDIDKVKLGHANLPNFADWVCRVICWHNVNWAQASHLKLVNCFIFLLLVKSLLFLGSYVFNFLSIAGIPDDRTKCTTWSWLSQGQEIFKGFCHLIETSLKEVAFMYSPETDHRYPFQSFKEIVAACLVKDPVKRPTAEKLLKHRFFKYARSNEILARTILDGLSPLGERFRMLRVCILISVMQYSSTRLHIIRIMHVLICLLCSGKRGRPCAQ